MASANPLIESLGTKPDRKPAVARQGSPVGMLERILLILLTSVRAMGKILPQLGRVAAVAAVALVTASAAVATTVVVQPS